MTDKPIIFSGPMLRALLEGRKTQTRRVLKMDRFFVNAFPIYAGNPRKKVGRSFVKTPDAQNAPIAIGDRLWVRESWSGEHVFRNSKPSERSEVIDCGHGDARFRGNLWYWADGNPPFGDWERPRPSIHMPRWASRMTLIVTDVRVQRLQDISSSDAIDEGVQPNGKGATPIDMFRSLWASIYGDDAWNANPWLAAYTFTVHMCNIDQMSEGT